MVNIKELNTEEVRNLSQTELIKKSKNIIMWVYHRYFRDHAHKHNVDLDDLYQEAAIIALRCQKKYDEKYGNFSTYLIKSVYYVFTSYINENKHLASYPKKAMRLAPKLVRNKLVDVPNSQIVLLDGFEDYTIEDIQATKSYLLNYQVASLELSQKYEGFTDRKGTPHIVVKYEEDFSCVFKQDYFNVLNEQEQNYLELVYYGYTQSQMAKELNISQAGVSRLKRIVQKKIINYLKKNDPECLKEYLKQIS